MYNEVYKKMAECGIAEKTDEACWYNSAGQQVDNEKMHRDDLPATI